MLERWAIGLVIAFVMRQLAKFQKSINWEQVKADIKPRIEQLVPGTWFDDEAVALANMVIDRCAEVLAQGEAIEVLLKLLADQKWAEAAAALKDLLLGGFVPAPLAEGKKGKKGTAGEAVAAWEPAGATMKKTANGLAAQGEALGDKAWRAVASL